MQGAVLAHGIAEGQFFIDGNKGLAVVAMLTFLELNGYRVNASDPDLAGWILDLATGTPPAELATRIRPTLTPTLPP
jgi:death-on-curing protein